MKKAERHPLIWEFLYPPVSYNSKEIPFFEWFAQPLRVVDKELFILPKEDPRMDMGRNSEHYSDPTPGTAGRICAGKKSGWTPPALL